MLLRHSPDMTVQHNEHMRGGKGTIAVKHLLKSDELFGRGRLFAEITIPPGASIGLHPHEQEIEAFYILEGRGRYQNNDEFFDVEAGDVTVVDDHDRHGIENTGDVPLRLIGLILFTADRK